jgi:hypothetical protein
MQKITRETALVTAASMSLLRVDTPLSFRGIL